jgi:hypothetical protein
MSRNTSKHWIQKAARTTVIERDFKAERAAIEVVSNAARQPLAPIPIKIRPMKVEDGGFVLDSWCSSYARSPEVGCDPEVFKIEQRNLIYRLIPKCKVLVACDPENPNTIRGWIAAEPPREPGGLWIIHYCLVKYELQGRGIARALSGLIRQASPNGMCWGTHSTFACKWFGKDWLVRNRYLLWTSTPASQKPVPVGAQNAYLGDL